MSAGCMANPKYKCIKNSHAPVHWDVGILEIGIYLPDICSSCFIIIFLTISPPMLPACAEVKSPL